MIFATVGTQLPFRRLIKALDEIAGARDLTIFAQTADPTYLARNIETIAHLDPVTFDEYMAKATLIVGHAGIGTVLNAKKLRKPLIIFPRKAALNEHRNDHQLATARALVGVEGVHVAWDEAGLDKLLAAQDLEPASPEGSATCLQLIARVRDFISGS